MTTGEKLRNETMCDVAKSFNTSRSLSIGEGVWGEAYCMYAQKPKK